MLKPAKISGINGSIALSQEYGFIPYLYSNTTPAHQLSGMIQAGFSLYGIPLKIDVRQSDKKTFNGAGNYITLSFDAPSYKNLGIYKINKEKERLKLLVDSLSDVKSIITKKLDYYKLLNLNTRQNFDVPGNDSLKVFHSSENVISNPEDSLLYLKWKQDSIIASKLPHSFVDSLSWSDLIQMYDSLQRKWNKINVELEEYKNNLAIISNIGEHADSLKSSIPGHSVLLQKIEKLELGLTSPSYSEWLINCPLKGVNIQLKSNETFAAASYGTIIDFNYLNVALKADRWKNIETDFDNLFHINNAQNGKKVMAGQFGFGRREGSYLSFGFLKGFGRQSYYSTDDSPAKDLAVDKNFVAEVVGQLHFRIHSLKFTYVKSALINKSENAKALDELAGKNDARVFTISHATDFRVLKASIKSDLQWVEPLFKSFGLSYRKSDRFNARVKLIKDFNNVKISCFYKFEQDNILNYYSFKNTSNSIGVNTLWHATSY